jgi:hypothetical protein
MISKFFSKIFQNLKDLYRQSYYYQQSQKSSSSLPSLFGNKLTSQDESFRIIKDATGNKNATGPQKSVIVDDTPDPIDQMRNGYNDSLKKVARLFENGLVAKNKQNYLQAVKYVIKNELQRLKTTPETLRQDSIFRFNELNEEQASQISSQTQEEFIGKLNSLFTQFSQKSPDKNNQFYQQILHQHQNNNWLDLQHQDDKHTYNKNDLTLAYIVGNQDLLKQPSVRRDAQRQNVNIPNLKLADQFLSIDNLEVDNNEGKNTDYQESEQSQRGQNKPLRDGESQKIDVNRIVEDIIHLKSSHLTQDKIQANTKLDTLLDEVSDNQELFSQVMDILYTDQNSEDLPDQRDLLTKINNNGNNDKCGYYSLAAGILQLDKLVKESVFAKLPGFQEEKLKNNIEDDQYLLGEAIFKYSTDNEQELLNEYLTIIKSDNSFENKDIIDEFNNKANIFVPRLQILAKELGIKAHVNDLPRGQNPIKENEVFLTNNGNSESGHYQALNVSQFNSSRLQNNQTPQTSVKNPTAEKAVQDLKVSRGRQSM